MYSILREFCYFIEFHFHHEFSTHTKKHMENDILFAKKAFIPQYEMKAFITILYFFAVFLRFFNSNITPPNAGTSTSMRYGI